MEKQTNPLATERIGVLIARFAVPSVVAMLVNALYNIVDQIFIGRGVGYLGNGAANVVLLLTLCALALSMLVGDGAAAYFSLKLGEGKPERAAEGARTALVLMACMGLAACAVSLLFLRPILRVFGCTDALLPYAEPYGRVIALGLPFIMISTSLNALIRADGSPRRAMLSMILGAVLNGCLDPLFIFGFGWGIAGAAWATFLGQLASFAVSLAYLPRMKRVRLSGARFRLRTAGRMCLLGLSSFVDQLAFTCVMAVNYNLIVRWGARSPYGGELPLTAYGIAMKVQEMLFTVVLGIALGMQPVVGFNFGAKQYGRVRRAYAIAITAGTVVSCVAAALFFLCPDAILGLFGASDSALYLEFGRRFFRTYFLLYPFFGFITISGVFFQAIGKPRQAAGLSLCYQLVFKIGAALLLCAALGLDGVLWSGPAADLAACVLTAALVWAALRGNRDWKTQDTVL